MKKYIFTTLVIFLGLTIFAVPKVSASTNLVVQFQNTPLFSEANFAPGESVTRWVKVINNTTDTQKIATETINENDSDHLASKMDILIKQGEATLYNDTLANFFVAGEKYLSDLVGNGIQTQYDFTITFDADAGDDYQNKTLGFDIIVGFQGQEGGNGGGGGGNGGGGGVLPAGLTISNTNTVTTTETSVTITWLTSYASTSQVIYALEGESHTLNLSDNAGNPPLYGYAHTTPETDVSPKVTGHTVTIFGLSPGTIYYYRTVSHGSLAISQEYSFLTSGVAGAQTEEPNTSVPNEQAVTTSGISNASTQENESVSGGNTAGTSENNELTAGKKEFQTNNTSFLATIASAPLNIKIIVSLIIVVLTVLVVLWFMGKLKLRRKNIIK